MSGTSNTIAIPAFFISKTDGESLSAGIVAGTGRSVERKGGVLPVVGFSGRLENPTFTLDENYCRASLPGQMGPSDNCNF